MDTDLLDAPIDEWIEKWRDQQIVLEKRGCEYKEDLLNQIYVQKKEKKPRSRTGGKTQM